MLPRITIGIALIVGLVWVNNSNLFVTVDPRTKPKLLSHRGVHQIFAGDTVLNDTCTSSPIRPIRHSLIENTLPSMRAAFDAGADVVELDIHLTPDNVFAVFHDWTLDCRTNGTGQTNKVPYTLLKTLDVAHNYSTDGKTFPLRGTGFGMIPTLTEVFQAFPDKQFLVNFKSNRREEGEALAALLKNNIYRDQVFGVYGGWKPTQAASRGVDGLRGFDRASVKNCVLRYIALGWTGYVPTACRNQLLMVPSNYAPFLWGWPLRFQERMAEHNTSVILVGPYTGTSRVYGIDTPELYHSVPEQFSGYIWTNKIEQIYAWQEP